MSKASDKARKESNARNRASADMWKKRAEAIREDYDTNQKKLERLKKAKKSLTKELSNLSKLEKNTSKLSSDISPSDFKGKLRDNYDKKVDQVKSTIHKDMNQLQRNMSTLDAAISKKELEQENLFLSLSSALIKVEHFLSLIV